MKWKGAYLYKAILISAVLSLILIAPTASAIQVGGTLVIAVPSEPTSLAMNSALYAGLVEAQIYDTLLRFDRSLNLVPGLAESYYVNTTCGCYVFKLRTNATWQDGQPVTAEDVKFTFEKIVPFYTNFGTLYFPNTTVTIVNSTTVIIKPGVFLPGAQLQLFAAPDTTPILPKHILEGQDFLKSSFLTNPIGSGPYKLSSWVKGSYIELVRNDNYWDDSKPYLSKIIIKFISDPSTIVAGLKKGEINYVFRGLPYETVPDLKTVPGLNVTISLRPPYAAALWINLNDTILSNPLVRQAIAYAINRTDIAQKATLGNAPVVDYVIDPDLVPPPSGLIHYERNLTLANMLLDKAGYPVSSNGTRFTLEVLTYPQADMQTIAQVLKDELKDVGINVVIKSVDFSTVLTLEAKGQYQIATTLYWLSPLWTYQLFHSAWIGKGPFTNNMFYNNSQVDKLLDSWLKESDPAKQTEYLQKVEMEINKDLPEIVLYRVPWVNVFSTNFAGSDIPIRGQWYFASTMLDVYYLPIQTTSSTTTPQQSTTTPANTTSGSSVGTPSGSIIWVIVGILILALITLAITVRRKK
ncbi:MAG: ABC transporter substrate-binding protein [Fervidicoccaceae archaeon]